MQLYRALPHLTLILQESRACPSQEIPGSDPPCARGPAKVHVVLSWYRVLPVRPFENR